MAIHWRPCEPQALDQRDAARLLRVDRGALADTGGWTRTWRRDGRGPDRPHDTYGDEGLHLHLAAASATPHGYHVLAVWEHELFVGHDHYFWRVDPFVWPDSAPAADPAMFDLRALLEAADPFSPHIPDTCPAWRWTVDDVVDYRGLANADSAYRWLHEQGIRITKAGLTRFYDGRQVVIKAAAMPGRGKGGGRPRAAGQHPTPEEAS